MSNITPISLITADLHFSDKRPRCRKESDWLNTQKGYINQLEALCEEYNVPLVGVGDIFDKSRHTNELVNMVIDNMPHCYVTSGNHDFSGHAIELEHKSAYGSFVRSKKPIELFDITEVANGVWFHPFHFGEEPRPCDRKKGINIALIHELVWVEEPFKDAPTKGNVNELVKRYSGYDIIVAGDNHQHFITCVDETVILNCGSLMRINASQKNYQPLVHLLMSDGSFKHIDIDVSHDIISDEHIIIKKETTRKLKTFVQSLEKGEGGGDIEFEEKVRNIMSVNDVSVRVKGIIEESMDG